MWLIKADIIIKVALDLAGEEIKRMTPNEFFSALLIGCAIWCLIIAGTLRYFGL